MSHTKPACCPSIGTNRYLLIAVVLGCLGGYLQLDFLYSAAGVVSELFINMLKLVSLPIIFLSIVSTASGMDDIGEVKFLARKVITYTLLTTVLAAFVALGFFLVIQPVETVIDASLGAVPVSQTNYLNHLLHIVPSNIIQPFSENQVIGVLFLAILLSVAALSLPQQSRKTLHSVFSSLYSAIMKITNWLVYVMPLAVWAFITLFFRDMRNETLEFKSLALYLSVVVAANLFQALVVLPIFLKWKGLSPLKIARGMLPALSAAFFTKSSNAALPMAIRCAEENVKIAPKVANFSFPLCTTINMNGCAAFILTTVMFVSMSYGHVYALTDMLLWVGIATIAAVGNAGVPMGCFFLSSALLATMNVPLNLLGVILPFYSLIDMLETAINVWSDSCVTAAVDRDVTFADAPVAIATSE